MVPIKEYCNKQKKKGGLNIATNLLYQYDTKYLGKGSSPTKTEQYFFTTTARGSMSKLTTVRLHKRVKVLTPTLPPLSSLEDGSQTKATFPCGVLRCTVQGSSASCL